MAVLTSWCQRRAMKRQLKTYSSGTALLRSSRGYVGQAELPPQITEYRTPHQPVFTLPWQKPLVQRGQAGTPESRSSAPRHYELTTGVHSSPEALIREHQEAISWEKDRVNGHASMWRVGHLAKDSDLHHRKVFLEEHPASD